MLLFTPGDFIQLMPIVLSVSSVGIRYLHAKHKGGGGGGGGGEGAGGGAAGGGGGEEEGGVEGGVDRGGV